MRRSIASAAVLLASIAAAAALRIAFPFAFVRVLSRQIDYYVSLLILFLLFDAPAPTLLLQWCAGMAASDLSARLFDLLIVLCGHHPSETISLFAVPSEARDLVIRFVFQWSVILLCRYLFGRRKLEFFDSRTERSIVILSFIAALSLGLLNGVTREYMGDSTPLYTVILLLFILLSSLILFLRTGILTQGQYRQEIDFLEQLLREEKKQFEAAKQNVDVINMKVHDLKHRLDSIDDRLTGEEIASLRDAVGIYDNSINTGSEALNVLLYEKQLICEKEGIRISCMADGHALDFMRPAHLYALFNNAIENAIEAVQKLSVPEKKLIDITVERTDLYAQINVSNYFEPSASAPDAVFSTKADAARHGYGMKSMRYILSQYRGTLSYQAEKDMFHLTMRIPFPPKR
ncbi:MAG: sensor histidine kinase [Clostridia bacterium]|nr:sensor histidine kinase [Clostridia bacterium]